MIHIQLGYTRIKTKTILVVSCPIIFFSFVLNPIVTSYRDNRFFFGTMKMFS